MFRSSGDELVLLASAYAMGLAKNLTVDEVATLSEFLNAVSDNLAIIATQRDILDSSST